MDFLFIYFVYMDVLSLCISAHQKRALIPGTTVRDGGEHGYWELSSGPLEEQPALFSSFVFKDLFHV